MKDLMENWNNFLTEKAETEKQKRFMHAVERCKEEGDCPSDEIKKAADSMTMKQVKDFTEHPVKEESKDKYGSEVSDKAQASLDAATNLDEKDDRCTRIAKRKYDVWPSAYASGAVVQCRKGKIWKDLKEEDLDEKAKTDYSKEKDSGLHGWFSRQGGKGKSSGWVDCNTCRKDPKTGRKKCKSCGRGEGEKRSKYPSCRPTPSACGTSGKGEKWGKKKESISLTEEQIDTIVEEILTQLDESGKCTGPTQKASSTSKGKKWMQCVKNPDGKGYKRIHWGQKGVRVTGDSGNTKRKKSFRARHGCKDAKPGTAKYMACKDW